MFPLQWTNKLNVRSWKKFNNIHVFMRSLTKAIKNKFTRMNG